MGSPALSDSADAAGFAAKSIGGQLSDEDIAGIGYEAACPWLHEPLWFEAQQTPSDASAY